MFAVRATLSHRSELPPGALLAALARRVKPDAWRPMFTRVDMLVGGIDGSEVWLRPVATRWENPPCELVGVVEGHHGSSVLRGAMRLPARADRVMVGFLPFLGLALAAVLAVRESPMVGLAVLAVFALMRLVLHGFCVRARAEILRVVRIAELDALGAGGRRGAGAPGSLRQ